MKKKPSRPHVLSVRVTEEDMGHIYSLMTDRKQNVNDFLYGLIRYEISAGECADDRLPT